VTWPRPAVAALAGLLLALAAGCAPAGSTSAEAPGPAIRVEGDQHGYRGTWLDQPYTKPALGFVDTSGRPFDLAADTTKPVTLVFFGYTNCPDICLDVLAGVAAALRRVDAQVREQVQLVFVTTDPARDTPQAMREYLGRFDPSFVGLTAPLPTIERAAAHLDIELSGIKRLPGGGYEVGHGAQLIGFGPPAGKGHLVWGSSTPVADLRHDIVRLATVGA
jgi:protein SCO1